MTPTKFQHAGLDWTPHTPGDPMPCDGDTLVRVLLRYEQTEASYDAEHRHVRAVKWDWDDCGSGAIIGWHPVEEQPDPAADIARLLAITEQQANEIKETKEVLQQVDLPDEPLLVQAKRMVDQHDWQLGIARGLSRQIEQANQTLRGLREENDKLRDALNSFDAIDKERNDALKTCMTLLENMHANRNQHKVAAYTDEIEAATAQIKTCYDPHA